MDKHLLQGHSEKTPVDIILINTPIIDYGKVKKSKTFVTAPLGLGYLATIANNLGFNVGILDFEANKLSVEQGLQIINHYAPKLVGINIFSTNHVLAKRIIEGINHSAIIAGGPHATLRTAETFEQNQKLNFIIRGEAEEVWKDNLHHIINKDYSKVKDISFNNQFITKITEINRIENLDSLPFIDRSYFINDPYTTKSKTEASMTTSRGCPKKCVFCSVPNLNGRKIRSRSIDNILKEIIQLKNNGVTSIHLIDDNFTINKPKLIKFCKQLINNNININWRILGNIDQLNKQDLELMKKSGCYKIGVGIESASEQVRDFIGKNINFPKLKANIEHCNDLGIHVKGFFTIGYPTETKEHVLKTIDLSQKLPLKEACFTIVRAFPETPLYNYLKEQGWEKSDLEEYKQYTELIKSKSNNSFNPNRFLKYHVSNKKSISEIELPILKNLISKAYDDFY